MLDQKPDSDGNASESNASGGADDILFDQPQADTSATETPKSPDEGAGPSGGMLGRFRAGVTARPEGERPPPLWRRMLVFLVKWLAILAVAFLLFSLLAVWIIGWTGPPSTLNMASRAMAGIEVKREWVKLSDVSPNIVRAVIAAEDQNFCAHDGFDFKEIQKAIDDAERGRRVRGASTISQQTAKNVFLWNGGGWARKGVETWFTILVEAMWSKPRIMEIYLNVAEWGDGNFGVEAAAQARFGVSAAKLTNRQAALLASVLPSPNRWKVDGNYAGRRASQVQSLMRMVRRDDLDACVIR